LDRYAPPDITALPLGHPIWKPVDFHMFAAPIGTESSGYVEFNQTMQMLLPPPDHVWDPALGIGPGAAHVGNYSYELRDSVRALRLRERQMYMQSEFTQGQGVFLVWMNVPSPGTNGSSPDFGRGPIIPNALFPIHVTGTDYRNGRTFSVLADFEVPPLDANLGKRYAGLDGHSHFPIFIADNADFGPTGTPQGGSYSYVVTMLDKSGQGWIVVGRFDIESGPAVAGTSMTVNTTVKPNSLVTR
jgi:hypothetical protein